MNSNIAEQMCDAEETLVAWRWRIHSVLTEVGGQTVSNGPEQMVPGLGQGRMKSTLLAKKYSSQVQEMDDVTVGHVTCRSFEAPNVVFPWASVSSSVKWKL